MCLVILIGSLFFKKKTYRRVQQIFLRLGKEGTMDEKFVSFLGREANTSYSENGAKMWDTTNNPLLDINFAISSMRGWEQKKIGNWFRSALQYNTNLALKWLLYLRDIRGGAGERRSFRLIMGELALNGSDILNHNLSMLVPELYPFCRWDDIVEFAVWPYKNGRDVTNAAIKFVYDTLTDDLAALTKYLDDIDRNPDGKHELHISLLAKWMPSINTSSAAKRRAARILAKRLGMDQKTYRKTLSLLRQYLPIVEVKMSANEWESIDYEKVGAKAGMIYNTAFFKHDEERRLQYIIDAAKGGSKMNIGGITPHEIVHKLLGEYTSSGDDINSRFCNALWDSLVRDGYKNDFGLKDALVVADLSGSMCRTVGGNTSVEASDVSEGLGLYFASQTEGPLHDKLILFSDEPRFIDVSAGKTLTDKLRILRRNACNPWNTNIEKVFMLVLNFAVSNKCKQDDLPNQIVIISDMEFDAAVEEDRNDLEGKYMDRIRTRYNDHGYKLPKLVFWNVCSSTMSFPAIDEMDNGVTLLSGFSQNSMKVAASDKKDPFEALKDMLNSGRYDIIDELYGDNDIDE